MQAIGILVCILSAIAVLIIIIIIIIVVVVVLVVVIVRSPCTINLSNYIHIYTVLFMCIYVL